MALTRIYTKTGDDGVTSLVGGVKVRKTNARIEAYGTVDELSAHLGLLASWMKDGDDKDLIIRTQRNLFTVCSYLATDKTKTPLAPSYTLDAEETQLLEDQIDEINANIPPQTAFILPGGSHEAATHLLPWRDYRTRPGSDPLHQPTLRLSLRVGTQTEFLRWCARTGVEEEQVVVLQ